MNRKSSKAGGHRRRIDPLRRGIRWTVVAALLLGGCATQADVMDMQSALDKRENRDTEFQNRLQVIENYFKERSTTVQRSQADLVIKLDQVAVDLQAVQGRLEESNHLLADLSQRMDDQSFRTKEMAGRIDALDVQLSAMGRSVAVLSQAVAVLDKGGTLPPELRPSSQPDLPPPTRGNMPPDQRVVIPGRPTETDRTTGLSPSEAYGLAYNDYLKGNYDLALTGFQNFLTHYKTTSLAPNAQYWIGESFYGKKDYAKSIEAFNKVAADYPKSEKVPGSLLKAGYALIEMGDKAAARSYLKKVVETYPLSNEARLAKNKLVELK